MLTGGFTTKIPANRTPRDIIAFDLTGGEASDGVTSTLLDIGPNVSRAPSYATKATPAWPTGRRERAWHRSRHPAQGQRTNNQPLARTLYKGARVSSGRRTLKRLNASRSLAKRPPATQIDLSFAAGLCLIKFGSGTAISKIATDRIGRPWSR